MTGAPLSFRWDGEEEWRVVASFPAYSISSRGRIRRDWPVRGGGGSVRIPQGYLTARPLPRGHLQVTLSMGNRPTTVLVHRLVAEAFLPPPMAGQDCVCHRDDDPSNNRPDNLFWGTRQDNTADMVRKGRQRRGERVANAKLTSELVAQIRRRVAEGESQYTVAAQFGVAQSNVSLIVSRRTWRHAP